MEYVKGKELFDFIAERFTVKQADTAIILKQMLKTVRYLNSMGLCHRDIKPENILIGKFGI